MSDARTERIDAAVASAGELIAALQDWGPVVPNQAKVIVMAAVRAEVPNAQDWEIKQSAVRVSQDLKKPMGEKAAQLALPLEGE